jgi:hypothetical protein
MPTSEQAGFMSSDVPGFGSVGPDADRLHPNPPNQHPAVAETYWFSFFHEPSGLHGGVYLWAHPNLSTTSAGVWIFRGVKAHRMDAEHFHYEHHLPWPTTDGDVVSVPALGLEIEVVEPLAQHIIRYRDPASGTSLQLRTTGVIPPVVRGNNAHFEQPMLARGELVLGSDTYTIDCVAMRDRSWGEPRPEGAMAHPPIGFAVGASADGNIAFTFNGTDDPDTADWAGLYDVPAAKQLKDGWIWRDGQLRKLVSMTRTCTRDQQTLRPTAIRVGLTDDHGQEHSLQATLLGCLPFSPWAMIQTHWCPVAWQLDDGTVIRGEVQDAFWPDYVRHLRGGGAEA